jgi:hypothetical protein
VVAADGDGFVDIEGLGDAELEVAGGVDSDYATFPKLVVVSA